MLSVSQPLLRYLDLDRALGQPLLRYLDLDRALGPPSSTRRYVLRQKVRRDIHLCVHDEEVCVKAQAKAEALVWRCCFGPVALDLEVRRRVRGEVCLEDRYVSRQKVVLVEVWAEGVAWDRLGSE